MRFPPFFVSAVTQLKNAEIEAPTREARLLLSHYLGISPDRLIWDMPAAIPPKTATCFQSAIDARCQHKPLSRIIGQREFYGYLFKVTDHTLDPRPDSETLIEAIQKRFPDATAPLNILDLGTGSGCLLLTLLKLYPNARGVGIDVSEKALYTAQQNAIALSVSERTRLICSAWASGLNVPNLSLDIVVSNPPYIPLPDAVTLSTAVRAYDPPQALYGGEDGLDCYRALMHIFQHLPGTPSIYLEVGYNQSEPVKKLGSAHSLTYTQSHPDLQGHWRIIEFSKRDT